MSEENKEVVTPPENNTELEQLKEYVKKLEAKNYELIGWQVEDIYQNLAITYIFDTVINKNINEKIFRLPKMD